MELKDIVKKYLDDNGYDGLLSEDAECACDKDDLFPCGEPSARCTAGYKITCDCGEHDYHISTRLPG